MITIQILKGGQELCTLEVDDSLSAGKAIGAVEQNLDVLKPVPGTYTVAGGTATLGGEREYGAGIDLRGALGTMIGPIILTLFYANQGRIEEVSDRVMTVPEGTIRGICRQLGIRDAEAIQRVIDAFRVWGDKGGDVLVTLANERAIA